MNDLERDAWHWLARYREEERPPPQVDMTVRTRIRRELRGHTRTVWTGIVVAAAVMVLLLWALEPRGSSLGSERDASFGALYAGLSADARVATERALKDQPVQAPRPALTPELVEQPTPQAYVLLEARRRIDAGNYVAALELLKPCPQKVGTDALLEECESLVIEAMCKSGDITGGRRQFALFGQGRRDSIDMTKLSEFCQK